MIVTGIWPPDVGGPATHASELAGFLTGRGHEVVVVTTADRAPAPAPFRLRWVSRRARPGIRHLQVIGEIARAARKADVVYSTGMTGRTGLAGLGASRPLVVRLVADPAYERALRLGLTGGSLDAFQRRSGARVAVLRAVRDLPLRRATAIVSPSAFLRDLAAAWGVDRTRVVVVPNPAAAPPLDDRDELRRRHGFEGATLVFAGRFVAQKSIEVGLEALRLVDGPSLVLVGDGPERPRMETIVRAEGLDDRVRFLGSQPHATVFELARAADALLLPSSWENFPHSIVEGFVVGTPTIATAVGGIPELVDDGENGLLVPPQDPAALAEAVTRFFADEALRKRLRSGASESAAGYAPESTYSRIEAVLERAAGGPSPR